MLFRFYKEGKKKRYSAEGIEGCTKKEFLKQLPKPYHSLLTPHFKSKEKDITFHLGVKYAVVEMGTPCKIHEYTLLSQDTMELVFAEGTLTRVEEHSALLINKDQQNFIVITDKEVTGLLKTFLSRKSYPHQMPEGTIGRIKGEVGVLTRTRSFSLHDIYIELAPYEHPVFTSNKTLIKTNTLTLPIVRIPDGFVKGGVEAFLIYRYPEGEVLYEDAGEYLIRFEDQYYIERFDTEFPLANIPTKPMSLQEGLLNILMGTIETLDIGLAPVKRLLGIA